MKDSGKIVNFSFDVDNMIIDAPCPECLCEELTENQYVNLCYLLWCTLDNLGYLNERKNDGKSKSSKKKSR